MPKRYGKEFRHTKRRQEGRKRPEAGHGGRATPREPRPTRPLGKEIRQLPFRSQKESSQGRPTEQLLSTLLNGCVAIRTLTCRPPPVTFRANQQLRNQEINSHTKGWWLMAYQSGQIGPLTVSQDNSGDPNDTNTTVNYTPDMFGLPLGAQFIAGLITQAVHVFRGDAQVQNLVKAPDAVSFNVFTQAADDGIFGHHSGSISVVTTIPWYAD